MIYLEESKYTNRAHWIFLSLMIVYYIAYILSGIVIPKKSPIMTGLHFGMIFYFTVYTYRSNRFASMFLFIFVYVSFILSLIILTSSNLYASLRLWTKYTTALFCLPMGFDLFNSEFMEKYRKTMMIFIGLFIVNYLLANILHLGGSRYGTDVGIDTGNIFDDSLYSNVCIMIMLPIMLLCNSKSKLLTVLAVSFCIIVTVICLKRTVIVCIFISIILYYILEWFYNLKYGKLTRRFQIIPVQYKIVAFVFIILIGCLFVPVFEKQLIARNERLGVAIESESRFQELEMIVDDIIFNQSDKIFFFGQETFNTVGTYAHGYFGNRMIHENYGIMLNGTGIIGLAFYIFVNFYILYLFFRFRRFADMENDEIARLMSFSFLSIWTIYFIASFSGTIWSTLFPMLAMTTMGMILRYFHSYDTQDDMVEIDAEI